MARLIDADLLDKSIEEQVNDEWNKKASPCSWAHALNDFRDMLDEQPTIDAVEVVRCKDCKYLEFSDFYGECGFRASIVHPDDFCSMGEKR